MKKLILLLLIVGCEGILVEPEDCAYVVGGDAVEDNCGICDNDPTNDCVQDCDDVWGGENNYCLQADYRYPLEIGNRWEYELLVSPTPYGDMHANIIVTIIDTVTLLDSINAYKFEHILIGLYYNSQIDTSYIYGNNNENGFVIYGISGYALEGLPRVEIGLNGFSFNTIFEEESSSEHTTGFPSSSLRIVATGVSENSSSNPVPEGLPRWLMRVSEPPRERTL